MKNEYRNEFASSKSLDGSLMYLLLQVFDVAEDLEKEKNVKLEHFSKEDFIKLFNSGRWTSAEDVFRVRHVLRSYGEYLNTRGQFFNFKGLSEIQKKDLDRNASLCRFYDSFEELRYEIGTCRFLSIEWRDKSILLLSAIGLTHEEIAQLCFEQIDVMKSTITTAETTYREIEGFILEFIVPRDIGMPYGRICESFEVNPRPFTKDSSQKAAIKAAKKYRVSERSLLPSNLKTSYLLLKLWEVERKEGMRKATAKELVEYWTGRPIGEKALYTLWENYRDWKANK